MTNHCEHVTRRRSDSSPGTFAAPLWLGVIRESLSEGRKCEGARTSSVTMRCEAVLERAEDHEAHPGGAISHRSGAERQVARVGALVDGTQADKVRNRDSDHLSRVGDAHPSAHHRPKMSRNTTGGTPRWGRPALTTRAWERRGERRERWLDQSLFFWSNKLYAPYAAWSASFHRIK